MLSSYKFSVFHTNSGSMKWLFLFFFFFGPYSPKYGPILLKSSRQYLRIRKTLFKEYLKKSNFYGNRKYPKITFLFQLWPPFFSLKMAEIEKKKKKKNTIKDSIWQIWQKQGPISSSLSRKNAITFCLSLAIFERKQGVVTFSRVGIKIWHNLLQSSNSWAT